MQGSQVVERLVHVAEEGSTEPVLTTGQQAVSLPELVARAGAVAAVLRTAERGRSRPVATVAADGVELAAVVLACLAEGQALLALDPRMGRDVLAGLLAATEAKLLLSSLGHIVDEDELPVPVHRLDPHARAALSPRAVRPSSIALFGHTSGSTGQPKIRSFTVSDVDTLLDRRRLGPHDRFGMLLGAGAGAVRRMLEALSAHAHLTCVDARREPASRVLGHLARDRVTHLWIVPTYLRRSLAVTDGDALLPHLEHLWLGAEPITWDDVALVRTRLSAQASIRASYGTTETGGICSNIIGPFDGLGRGTVAAGLPQPGRRVWISREDGTPAVIHETGEVIVELDQVRGGVEHEQLGDGRVRYATGDLGHLRENGQLVLAGRTDRRLKIGGVHVQLAQVESVLGADPAVIDAHVVATPGPSGEQRLLAFVHAQASDSGDLRRRLLARARHRLHEAAVPAMLWVRAEPLPTLANGKVDSRQLAALAAEVHEPGPRGR